MEVKIHRDCLILWRSDVFHFDLRGDSFRMGLCGIAGCLICLIGDFLEGGGRFWKGGYIGIECFYGVLMYSTMICAAIRFGWDYVASRVA